MNKGKVVVPYRFPISFIKLMTILHRHIDYRGLEGIARELAKYSLIPYYGDFSTLWHRIHNFRPELDIPEYNNLEIASDGTGLKTSNAGKYMIDKYHMKKRNKYIVVVITSDVRTKKLLSIDVYVQGNNSESKVVKNHISELSKDYSISKFYGDGAYDNYDMFNLLASIRYRAVIKRWNGTEGINSSVKRKFGENMVSKLPENLVFEGYQRFWAYDTLKNYAEINLSEH